MFQLQAQQGIQIRNGHKTRMVDRNFEMRFQAFCGVGGELTLLKKTMLHFDDQFIKLFGRTTDQ